MKFASGDRFHQHQARRDVPFVADGRHMIRTNMPCRRQSSADSKRLVPMCEYSETATDRASHLPRASGNSDCTKVGMQRRPASTIPEILERIAGIDPPSQAEKTRAQPLGYTRQAPL